MRKIEVETFADATNATIVRLPGRKFPGIVIQGDSLKILSDCANVILRLSRELPSDGLVDAAEELVGLLDGYRKAYEEALHQHQHPLPYRP